MSFSKKVKDEYCELDKEDICCIEAEVLAAIVCSGRFRQGNISISTSHGKFARRLRLAIRDLYATEVSLKKGRELYIVSINENRAYNEIISDLIGHAGFDAVRGTIVKESFTSLCCRKAFLRGMFLSGGSISEPSKSYHLEIATRRLSVVTAAMHILESENIAAGMLKRSGYYVLYMKESQHISDFLLITGAHKAMLEFESTRVDKSVRNSVNRVVNCDSANCTKIAYTGARQQRELEYIKENIGFNSLPEELRKTALLRLENPDLSLKQLGESMDPPVGKSGINHRLKKLEKMAKEHREKGKSEYGT